MIAIFYHIKYTTVEPVLKDHPNGHKNMVSGQVAFGDIENIGTSARNIWSFKTGGLSWEWSLKTGFTVVIEVNKIH